MKLATDNGYGYYEIVTVNTALSDGNWHFLTGLRNSNTLKVYLDGKLVSSAVGSNTSPPININNNIPLYIGSVAQVQEKYKQFNGELDELRIWNRALSQSEIQTTMNQSLSGTESGLVGYYTFSDQNGADSSKTHNNASPVGNVSYTSPGAISAGAVIAIPSNTMISLTGTSNSSDYSKVTVDIDGFSPIIFTGTGENVPLLSDGQAVITLNSGAADSATLIFEYSTNGASGPFETPIIFAPVITESNGYVTVTNNTENGDDEDNNDTVFVLNWSE